MDGEGRRSPLLAAGIVGVIIVVAVVGVAVLLRDQPDGPAAAVVDVARQPPTDGDIRYFKVRYSALDFELAQQGEYVGGSAVVEHWIAPDGTGLVLWQAETAPEAGQLDIADTWGDAPPPAVHAPFEEVLGEDGRQYISLPPGWVTAILGPGSRISPFGYVFDVLPDPAAAAALVAGARGPVGGARWIDADLLFRMVAVMRDPMADPASRLAAVEVLGTSPSLEVETTSEDGEEVTRLSLVDSEPDESHTASGRDEYVIEADAHGRLLAERRSLRLGDRFGVFHLVEYLPVVGD